MSPGGFELATRKRAAAEPRLRPRGHRDRHTQQLFIIVSIQPLR